MHQTSKTRKIHATAIVNDERGALPPIIGNTARGASEPAKPEKRMPLPVSTTCRQKRRARIDLRIQSLPLHVENRTNTSKSHREYAEYVSIVEPSIARTQSLHRRAQQPCPETGQRPQARQLRDSTIFCALQPGHCRCTTTGTDNQPKNCTCEGPRSAAQCALCVPGAASSWMSTILLVTKSTTGFIRRLNHAVDELKHTRGHEHRLLELVVHVHRDVHSTSTAKLSAPTH